MSLPRCYHFEANGLQGLVAGCTPEPKGRLVNPAHAATALRRDNQRLQRELGRQQALLRLTQRGLGVTPPTKPVTKKGRRRKPVVRALTLAARLQPETAEPAHAIPSPPDVAKTPPGYFNSFRFCKSNSAAFCSRSSKTRRKSPLAKSGTV